MKSVRGWGRLGMKYKLEEIVDVTMGQSPKSQYYNNEGNGIPFLQGNRTFGFKKPTFDTYTTLVTKLAKAGDVIMSVRAPVGDLNITPVDMCLGRGVCSLRMKNGNQEFLFYMMKYYIPQLINKENGTVFGSVSRNDINGLEVNIPQDNNVQKKIARYLTMIDDKIELNNAINDNLLEQANVLFDNAIRQSTSISYAELGSMADIKGGKRLPKGINLTTVPNSHPYIRVRDLNNTVFASLSTEYEYVDDEIQKSISRYTVSKNDVLISIVGTIGLTAIVDSTLDKANLTENCVKITNIKHVTPEYLLLFLRSSQGTKAMLKGTVGAVQLKLPIKNIQSISVPLLSIEELQSLNEVLSLIFVQISSNIVEIKHLAGIRDTLLPKLMSGELDISDIDF